ncbi:MAG TPA: hypothetical protein VIL86_16820 [Tepidisphaeraceae bacterium]|jgi:hypothetical protein
MPSPTLNDDEISALRTVLSQLVIRERTGEVGILHGLDRFVSTNVCLKKPQRAALDSALRKLGLNGIAKRSI